MIWTHIYDLLCKLAGFAIIVTILVQGGAVVAKDQFWMVISSAMILGLAAWYLFLRPLSSWCYARMSLKTSLTFAQARRASALFSPLLSGLEWHPMWDVRDLPVEQRCSTIIDAADELLAYHHRRTRKWRAAPVHAKVLRVLLWSSPLGVIVLTAMNLPPMSWLSKLQALMFGGTYFPVVNIVVCSLPIGIAIAMLERKYGVRSVDPHAQALQDSARENRNTPPK